MFTDYSYQDYQKIYKINKKENTIMKKLNLYFKNMLLISALFIFSSKTFSQWTIAGNLSGITGRPTVSIVDEKTAWVTGGDPVNSTYRTTNSGANWTLINTTGLNPFLCIWAVNSNTVFAGDNGNGGTSKFYKTIDGGVSWKLIDSVSNTTGFRSIKFSKSMPDFGIALGAISKQSFFYVYYIYKTRDGGNTWTKYHIPYFSDYSTAISSLNVIDSLFYAFGTTIGPPSVILTTDGGVTYNLQNLNLPPSTANFTRGVAFKEDKLTGIACGSVLPVIARTTNGGLNWININLGNLSRYASSSVMRWIEGTNICYMTSPYLSGILKSTNGGINWSKMTTSGLGTFNMDIKRIGSKIYGYSVTNNSGQVLKVTERIIKDAGTSEFISEKPILSPNYPNPFNPVTKIKFEIMQDGRREMQDVKLIVYNSLGKEVITLVNESLSAGIYEVDFDGSNLSSGVYFYKLVADGFVDTKRMYLVK